MSTPIINQFGNFPEGYCPTSYQQLGDDLVARIISMLPSSVGTFVTGSVEPTSNQGPWLKNGNEWWFWSDSAGAYRPAPRGFIYQTYINTAGAGNFTVPSDIYRLKITAIGGGGGGYTSGGGGETGSGGGGGAFGVSIIDVVPGQNIAYSVGAGGGPATNGSATTIIGGSAGGGGGAPTLAEGGPGGTATGFDINLSGGTGIANTSAGAAHTSAGGDAGGWGGKGGSQYSALGAAALRDGTAPGGGGGGGASNAGSVAGTGATGAILIEY